ncbi:F-box protein At4g00755-like [Asparagus officinalis]|uniref:F-box protein At4g00755-like n=1 Tax=Asparagus officinalis TaxID=4686 RepID=UPI00098E6F27|nr:F-box protein At4g00755-like [Asparagus officinalis]
MEWEYLEREHRAYSYLSHCFSLSLAIGDCIDKPIYASSTDNNQNESIENTLIEVEQLRGQPSYWSSKGENDPGVPETLTYRMGSKLCIINEINVWPFKAYFQDGGPIYSAKAVRFRMGYSIPPSEKGEDPEKFIWTHVSQKFPMFQPPAPPPSPPPTTDSIMAGVREYDISISDRDKLGQLILEMRVDEGVEGPLGSGLDRDLDGNGALGLPPSLVEF